MTEYSNRTSRIIYGISCSQGDNCFFCKVKPDCNCRTKESDRPNILVDEKVIWDENYKIPKMGMI